MKQTIVALVEARFTSLMKLTQKRLEVSKTSLKQPLIQLAQASDEKEARRVLLIESNEQ